MGKRARPRSATANGKEQMANVKWGKQFEICYLPFEILFPFFLHHFAPLLLK
jgi:hypothetical protein